jgi:hypothetical protein
MDKVLDQNNSLIRLFCAIHWLYIKTLFKTFFCAILNNLLINKINGKFISRYNLQTKALNLRKFHTDPAFLGEAFYAPLNRGNVMAEVIRIIGDNIPELEALDISENKIRGCDHFNTFAEKAPNVKILYIGDNNVSCIISTS